MQHTFGQSLFDEPVAARSSTLLRALLGAPALVRLNYKNPFRSPYDECLKHHSAVAEHLQGRHAVSCCTRAITKAGSPAGAEAGLPAGAIIGNNTNHINPPRIKGNHNAIRSGIQAVAAALQARAGPREDERLQ